MSTVNAFGQPLKSKEANSVKYYKQMTVWHNLMAIWLWRISISAIEGINIPGIASATGIILHYMPTFYLWAAVFMLSMLVTKKSADHHHVSLIIQHTKKKPLTLIYFSMPIHGMRDALQDLEPLPKKGDLAAQCSEVSLPSPTSMSITLLPATSYILLPLLYYINDAST